MPSVFSEATPSTAKNIVVDYSNNQPKAFFSYLNEKKEKSKRYIFIQLFGFSLVIEFFIFFIFAFFGLFFLLGYNVFNIISSIFIINTQIMPTVIDYGSVYKFLELFLFFCFILLPPIWCGAFLTLRYDSFKIVIPKFAFWIENLFTPLRKKTIKSLNSKIFKIPVFKNTFLKWEAVGDFELFLKKVNIHPCVDNYNVVFNGKEKKACSKRFEAVFEFCEIPKKGKLDVYWL